MVPDLVGVDNYVINGRKVRYFILCTVAYPFHQHLPVCCGTYVLGGKGNLHAGACRSTINLHSVAQQLRSNFSDFGRSILFSEGCDKGNLLIALRSDFDIVRDHPLQIATDPHNSWMTRCASLNEKIDLLFSSDSVLENNKIHN